jgi:hypothetical protein
MSKSRFLVLPAFALGALLVACGDRPNDAGTATSRGGDATTAEQRADRTTTDRAPAAPSPADERTLAQRAGEQVSDATITAEVKSALASDPQLSALKIDVDTRDGVVTLKGPAPDEKARSRATQIAAAPKGVMRVENQLEVKPS